MTMPTPALESMAKKAGVDLKKAEEYWAEAKKQAEKEGFKEGDDRFYAYMMGIVKRRMGLKKEKASSLHEEIASYFKTENASTPEHHAHETLLKHGFAQKHKDSMQVKNGVHHSALYTSPGTPHDSGKHHGLMKDLQKQGYTHTKHETKHDEVTNTTREGYHMNHPNHGRALVIHSHGANGHRVTVQTHHVTK